MVGARVTPSELAALRDKVTRARLQRAGNPRPRRTRATWTPEREAAGDAALAALHEAKRRREAKKRRKKERMSKPTQTVAKVVAAIYATCEALHPCVYCGGESLPRRWPHTCYGHSDLPRLDDAYAGELLLRGIA